jgi:hypothetical protein
MIKERPILFSTDMVQALLEGRKTQTRRVVKPQPQEHQLPISRATILDGSQTEVWLLQREDATKKEVIKCPYGQPGDVLWVRESFASIDYGTKTRYAFKADDSLIKDQFKWKPSIHMPKSAARIWLKVTDVRVERVQDISAEDAMAEGLEFYCRENEDPLKHGLWKDYHSGRKIHLTAYASFLSLWETIHGVPTASNANPWVWVVNFEVLSTSGKPNIENVEWLKQMWDSKGKQC